MENIQYFAGWGKVPSLSFIPDKQYKNPVLATRGMLAFPKTEICFCCAHERHVLNPLPPSDAVRKQKILF